LHGGDYPTIPNTYINCDVVEVDDLLALVCDDPDGGKVVAYRGSTNVPNWLRNLDCKMRRCPVGKVHEGFAKAEEAIWAKIRPLLHPLDAVTFTGHSLGGALACCSLARWPLVDARQPVALVTFGCPRVGDGAFASALLDRLLRFTISVDSKGVEHAEGPFSRLRRYHHRYDPVPWVPSIFKWGRVGPLWLPTGLDGFRHPCWPSWYDGERWTDLSLTKTGAVEAARMVKRAWKDRDAFFEDILTDHHIDNYVRALTPDVGSGT
jgi:hypothetical protein